MQTSVQHVKENENWKHVSGSYDATQIIGKHLLPLKCSTITAAGVCRTLSIRDTVLNNKNGFYLYCTFKEFQRSTRTLYLASQTSWPESEQVLVNSQSSAHQNQLHSQAPRRTTPPHTHLHKDTYTDKYRQVQSQSHCLHTGTAEIQPPSHALNLQINCVKYMWEHFGLLFKVWKVALKTLLMAWKTVCQYADEN